MSEFEGITGLRESQEADFNDFRSALAPYFDQLGKIGLKVLLWGPGQGTHYYFKRTEIKQSLQLDNSNDEIATSEDLLKEIDHPSDLDVAQAEMLHAQVADVIFGLVTSDPQQSGIYLEINNLLNYDSLINKTWIIIPDRRDWKKVGALIQQPLLQSFPSYRMKPFRMKVLEECKQVRRFCLERLKEERSRKIRKHIQSALGSG